MDKAMCNKIFNGLPGVIIVLVAIMTLNLLLSVFSMRADLTEEKLYTLSKGTRNMLDNMDRKVTLKYFFSESNKDVPVQAKNYGQRVRDLLEEYAGRGGKVILENYDPKPDTEQEEWARKYGLNGPTVGIFGAQPNFYMGLVALSGTREATIPYISTEMENQLEYNITRLINEVIQKKKPKIGVMSSLPVTGMNMPPQMMMQMPQQQQQQPWILVQELKRLYDVESVEIMVDAIPEDIDVLVLVHPKKSMPPGMRQPMPSGETGLSDETLYALDQFVMRGGRLIAFVDPICITESEVAPQQSPMAFLQTNSDINKLTEKWGIKSTVMEVVADNRAACTVTTSGGRGSLMPTWMKLGNENINRSEAATSDLDSLMLPFAGAIEGQPTGSDLIMTKLLTTYDKAAYVSAMDARGDADSLMKNATPMGEVALAVRLFGKFPSAFPDGFLSAPDSPDEQETAEGHLKQGEKNAIVILVGDADMIYDRQCVAVQQTPFGPIVQPLNDNLNFALNMIEQLAGNEALIGLRSRGTTDRPFRKVDELREKAQVKYQAQKVQLQNDLNETLKRITELEKFKKDSGERLFLSAEQRRERDEFLKKEVEIKRKLRDVSKNFREDIEWLGIMVKTSNILIYPMIIGLLGAAYGLVRKKVILGQ